MNDLKRFTAGALVGALAVALVFRMTWEAWGTATTQPETIQPGKRVKAGVVLPRNPAPERWEARAHDLPKGYTLERILEIDLTHTRHQDALEIDLIRGPEGLRALLIDNGTGKPLDVGVSMDLSGPKVKTPEKKHPWQAWILSDGAAYGAAVGYSKGPITLQAGAMGKNAWIGLGARW